MNDQIKILITGADGYIGSFLALELSNLKNIQVIKTSKKENIPDGFFRLDIRCEKEVYDVVEKTAPDIIIHTAALSNIEACEQNPTEAYRTNTLGTYNISKVANLFDIKVVYLSSLASKNSKLVYGRSKLDGEKYIRGIVAGSQIVYLSMVFGLTPNTHAHRPFNKILNAFITNTPIHQDNSWSFQPTYTNHLLEILIDLINFGFKDKDIIVSTLEHCTMYQITCDLIGKSLTCRKDRYSDRDFINNDMVDHKKMNLPTLEYKVMIQALKYEISRHVESIDFNE